MKHPVPSMLIPKVWNKGAYLHAARAFQRTAHENTLPTNTRLWEKLTEAVTFRIVDHGYSVVWHESTNVELLWTVKPRLVLIPRKHEFMEDFESIFHEYCHLLVASEREKHKINLGLDEEGIEEGARAALRECQASALELYICGCTHLGRLLQSHPNGSFRTLRSMLKYNFLSAGVRWRPPLRNYLRPVFKTKTKLVQDVIDEFVTIISTQAPNAGEE